MHNYIIKIKIIGLKNLKSLFIFSFLVYVLFYNLFSLLNDLYFYEIDNCSGASKTYIYIIFIHVH